MNTYIKKPLLVLLCLFLSVFCQAQNEVHCDLKIKEFAVNNSELGVVKHVSKGEFIFRKMNSDWRILAFTNEDAELITDFFLEKDRVLACESHDVDKKVKIFAERRQYLDEFPFKKYITELQEMGYFITSFRSSDEIIVFPMNNCAAAITIHDFEEDMAIYVECPPCGQVIVKDRDEYDDLIRVNDSNSSKEEDGLLKMNDNQFFEGSESGNVKVSQPVFEDTERTIDNKSLTNNKGGLEELLKDIEENEGNVEGATEIEAPVSEKGGLEELLKDIAENESNVEGGTEIEAPISEKGGLEELLKDIAENEGNNVEEGTEIEAPVSEKGGLEELLKDIAENEGNVEEETEGELITNNKAGLEELLKDIAENEGNTEEAIDSTSMEAIIKEKGNQENDGLPILMKENLDEGGVMIGEGKGKALEEESIEVNVPAEGKLGDVKISESQRLILQKEMEREVNQKKEAISKDVQEATPVKDNKYEG